MNLHTMVIACAGICSCKWFRLLLCRLVMTANPPLGTATIRYRSSTVSQIYSTNVSGSANTGNPYEQLSIVQTSQSPRSEIRNRKQLIKRMFYDYFTAPGTLVWFFHRSNRLVANRAKKQAVRIFLEMFVILTAPPLNKMPAISQTMLSIFSDAFS